MVLVGMRKTGHLPLSGVQLAMVIAVYLGCLTLPIA